MDAEDDFIDFGEVKAVGDGRFVHFMIDLRRTVNLQGLDGTALLLFNVDGDAATGRTEFGLEGVDILVELTPPNVRTPGAPGFGIGLRSTTHEPPIDPTTGRPGRLSPYDIGFSFAPTHASRRTEIRMERGRTLPDTPPLFTNQHSTAKLVYLDLAGDLRDATDAISVELPAFDQAAAVPDQPLNPLARGAATDLRVVSWNAFHGGIYARPEPFLRVLAALKPDVIFWQELPQQEPATKLAKLLNDADGAAEGRPWTVHIGEGGGDLRCAVASVFPCTMAAELTLVPFPGQADRTLRIAAALIDCHGQPLLAIATHLKCCGRANGPEDRDRLLEVGVIHDSVQRLVARSDVRGLLVAGDFNLVGSRAPLEELLTGLDLDGSALRIADPVQIDGRTNATWADPRQPFSPGRLDYAVYSDSTMHLTQAFVLDTLDLSPRWLEHHGLNAGDTAAASDHFPIVLDFTWVTLP